MTSNTTPLFGVSIIYKNGNFEYNSSSDYKKTHNKLIYEKCYDEIDKIEHYDKLILEKNNSVGLWSNAAIMTKFYDCIVVIESYEYKVALCFIPELVTSEQILTFNKIYTRDSYNDFNYGARVLVNDKFKVKPIKDQPLEYIYNILENKKANQRRR